VRTKPHRLHLLARLDLQRRILDGDGVDELHKLVVSYVVAGGVVVLGDSALGSVLPQDEWAQRRHEDY
jgi:hypothetical protein